MGPARQRHVLACVRARRPDVAARMAAPRQGWGWRDDGYYRDRPGYYNPGYDYYGPGPGYYRPGPYFYEPGY